jgi:hypothetical protein
MKTKGVAVRSILLSIEKIWEPAGLAKVLDALPAAIRVQLDPMVLAGNWYPVAVPAALHEAVRSVFGDGTWKHSYAIGVAAGKIDFGGVYRFVLRHASYETLFARTTRAWSQYQTQGSVTWTVTSTGFASGEITGVVGLNEGIWLSVAGRVAALLEIAGGRSVRCVVRDPTPTSCRFEASWVEK